MAEAFALILQKSQDNKLSRQEIIDKIYFHKKNKIHLLNYRSASLKMLALKNKVNNEIKILRDRLRISILFY